MFGVINNLQLLYSVDNSFAVMKSLKDGQVTSLRCGCGETIEMPVRVLRLFELSCVCHT